VVGPAGRGARAALAAALGEGGALLPDAAPGAGGALVADWDACWIDGAPVQDLGHWRALLEAGRLAQVEGAFAVAWLDSAGVLRLIRDAVGERTLYYGPVPDGLVFASTMSAVLATALVPRRLDVRAVAAYLSYGYVPGRATLIDGVRELLPGEVVEWRAGALACRRFWSLPAEPEAAETNEEALRARLRDSLEAAVGAGCRPASASGRPCPAGSTRAWWSRSPGGSTTARCSLTRCRSVPTIPASWPGAPGWPSTAGPSTG
jgi:asparagine synthase (glutamine-hydrolysing)